MTDFVYTNGDTVTFANGDIATAGDSTTAHVDTNDRVIMQPVAKLPAGVKPTGPVTIDWSNSLSRNLHSFVISHGGSLNELVRQNNTNSNGVVSGGNISYTTSQSDTVSVSPLASVTEYTIVYIGEWAAVSSWANWGGLFCLPAQSGSTNLISLQRNSSTGSPTFYHGAAKVTPKFSSSAGSGVHVFCFSVAEHYVYEWRNGVSLGSTFLSTDPGTNPDDSIIINGDRSAGANANQTFEAMQFFTRKLAKEEILSISRDPYQFLKSPTPKTQIITTAPTANDRVWIV